MTPEAAFFKAWGREPTRLERERIRRLQSAFSIDENDALLTIAMVLEFYDGHFRLYPGKCAEVAAEVIKRWLGSAEAAAVLRAALPAPSSSEEPRSPALPRDDLSSARRRELYWVSLGGLATASSAISGALGMVAGSRLSGHHPCWVPLDTPNSVVANVVGAPMGWIVLLALLVPAQHAATWGWKCGRDAMRPASKRWLGWAAFAAVTSSLLGWAGLLSRLALG